MFKSMIYCQNVKMHLTSWSAFLVHILPVARSTVRFFYSSPYINQFTSTTFLSHRQQNCTPVFPLHNLTDLTWHLFTYSFVVRRFVVFMYFCCCLYVQSLFIATIYWWCAAERRRHLWTKPCKCGNVFTMVWWWYLTIPGWLHPKMPTWQEEVAEVARLRRIVMEITVSFRMRFLRHQQLDMRCLSKVLWFEKE